MPRYCNAGANWYKVFCTITFKSYDVCAYSELEARKKVATELNFPLDCIIVWDKEGLL